MMTIQEIFGNDLISSLKKEYIKDDNTIKSKALVVNWVYNKFPEFKEIFLSNFTIEEFREVIYCILKDIPEIPKCENPNCNNNTKLRNFVNGFQKCCCKKCVAEYQHLSEEHKSKVLNGQQLYYNSYIHKDSYTENLNCDYSVSNYYIFKNYCKHGDCKVYRIVSNKIHEYNQGTFCKECNKELVNTYIPTEQEIIDFQNIFPEFYNKYSHNMKYNWWITYFPKYFKILIIYFEKYIEPYTENTDLMEMYYVFYNKLTSRPTCCMCNNHVEFNKSMRGYRKFCDDHLYGFNKSSQETDLTTFIDTLNINYIKNTQNIIQGELDLYFPEHNIAIEYNGCWWHSDKFKSHDYHINKYIQCKNKNIQLISIWEDNWVYKTDIIKSIIKSKLGIYDNRIYARKCILKEVSVMDTKQFLNTNHLQGYSIDKIRLGLYYNNELVSIMTFGKARFKSDDMEIIRFCNKLGYQIIGGASKLFKYFTKNYTFNNIVSYAEADISNGKLYEKLGMKFISHTENWKWMYKGIRYNRLNKIKDSGKDLVKCYTTGTLKFMYT